jgi:hypothetical protein
MSVLWLDWVKEWTGGRSHVFHLSVCLPARRNCLPACLLACLSVCLSIYLPVCPPACRAYSICLPVCLPPYQPNCLYEVIELTVVGKLRLYVTIGNQ